MGKNRPLAFHMALPPFQLVEQRVDVAAEPVELGDAERLDTLVEAAVEPNVVGDGRDLVQRLHQLIFEAAREHDGADRGDEQADEAGEQPEAYIVGQCGRIAPDLDRPDRRAVAATGPPERAREEDSGERKSVGYGKRGSGRVYLGGRRYI